MGKGCFGTLLGAWFVILMTSMSLMSAMIRRECSAYFMSLIGHEGDTWIMHVLLIPILLIISCLVDGLGFGLALTVI
jgi:hypothetical protein